MNTRHNGDAAATFPSLCFRSCVSPTLLLSCVSNLVLNILFVKHEWRTLGKNTAKRIVDNELVNTRPLVRPPPIGSPTLSTLNGPWTESTPLTTCSSCSDSPRAQRTDSIGTAKPRPHCTSNLTGNNSSWTNFNQEVAEALWLAGCICLQSSIVGLHSGTRNAIYWQSYCDKGRDIVGRAAHRCRREPGSVGGGQPNIRTRLLRRDIEMKNAIGARYINASTY